jgi:hypothetical protein
LAAVNEQVISMIFKSDLDVNRGDRQQPAVEETKVRRDDFSKMKASHDDLENQRREATKHLATNGGEAPERPLTRAERRMQERKGPKR